MSRDSRVGISSCEKRFAAVRIEIEQNSRQMKGFVHIERSPSLHLKALLPGLFVPKFVPPKKAQTGCVDGKGAKNGRLEQARRRGPRPFYGRPRGGGVARELLAWGEARILDEMIQSEMAMEGRMRENFAVPSEVNQTMLSDLLGKSGYKERDW